MKKQALRKQPVQQRSSDRLARILDAAARVFEDRGFEGATTEAIAQRAGISIGSLYQYFPGKAAVFRALADRFLTQTRSVFDQVVVGPELSQLPLEELVGSIVDTYAALHHSVPGVRALMLQGPFSPEIVASTKELFAEFERRISQLLHLRWPKISPEERHRVAAVCVYVFHILTTLSLRGDPAFGDQGEAITQEMKHVLINYLREHDEANRGQPGAAKGRKRSRG